MKKIKILTILAAAALLTGCNLLNSSGNFKPAKYSKESDCASLNETFASKLADSGIPTSPDAVDFSLKGGFRTNTQEELSLNGKVKDYVHVQVAEDFVEEFDKDSMVAHNKLSGSIDYQVRQGFGAVSMKMKQRAKNECYAQETQTGTNEYTITIASKTEGDYSKSESDEQTLYSSYMQKAFQNSGYNALSFVDPDTYAGYTDEQKANYKFYVDGNQFTQINENVDTETDAAYEAEGKVSAVVQFKIEKMKLSYYISVKESIRVKYLQDVSSYLKGSEILEENEVIYKGTFDFNECSVKMIDVSKLEERPVDYSVNSMFNLDLGL